MRPQLLLSILIALCSIPALQGQSPHDLGRHKQHRVGKGGFCVSMPDGFVPSGQHRDEFVLQEKGAVIRFIEMGEVSAETVRDSMTASYFASQGLRQVEKRSLGGLSIFTGSFDIGQVPYLRSFLIMPDGKGSILGIANYPAALREELEPHILSMFKQPEDD